MKFLKQATYIRSVIAKLQNIVQISVQIFSDSILEKIEKDLELVSRPYLS